jgi:lipoprotein NlpI
LRRFFAMSAAGVAAVLIAGAEPAAAQSAEALNMSGDAAVRSGNLTRAFEHYSAAIGANPFHARALRNRARVHFYRADFVAAAEDFRIAGSVDPANAYSLLWRYVAEARSGLDDRAGLAAGAGVVREGWPKPLVLFFLGRTKADAVFAAAAADPQLGVERTCEAQFFLAQRHLLAAEKGEAARLLRLAAESCPAGMVERHAARVELERLSADAR